LDDKAGPLELWGLSRRYGDVVALDDLTLTVPPGQAFGFLGPNGAGKTTAMRAIVGMAALDRSPQTDLLRSPQTDLLRSPRTTPPLHPAPQVPPETRSRSFLVIIGRLWFTYELKESNDHQK
jgi:energy-coupling factor transporter ATP-binding protein EcfA2